MNIFGGVGASTQRVTFRVILSGGHRPPKHIYTSGPIDVVINWA